MNEFNDISKSLNSWFTRNKIAASLMPLDFVFIGAALVLMLLNVFISIGSFISALLFYIFIAGLLLAYANLHQEYMSYGLLGYGAIALLRFIIYIFRWGSLSWYYLFACIVTLLLGLCILALSKGSSIKDLFNKK